MYVTGTIRTYVDDASAGRPTPGGGSVSALAAALGVCMGCMAANFTVGKKKFKDVEPQVKELLAALEAAREELLRLTDEDTQVYGGLDRAYAMPKDAPAQQQARTAAIQEALKGAMSVPVRIVRQCAGALDTLARLVDIANPNLISDVGVAAILAEASLRTAALNVDINLKYLKDGDLGAATRREVTALSVKAAADCAVVAAKVEKALAP